MKILDVQRKDVAGLHHGLRAHLFQANRAVSVLSKMCSLAELWGWRLEESNPCRNVARYKERLRERFLTDEETVRLGAALHEFKDAMPAGRSPRSGCCS